jgi:hypothetical protein
VQSLYINFGTASLLGSLLLCGEQKRQNRLACHTLTLIEVTSMNRSIFYIIGVIVVIVIVLKVLGLF